MPPTLQRLDQHLGLRYSQHTRRRVRGQAERFLAVCGAKDVYPQAELLAYVDHLILSGQQPASIKVALSSIKVFFAANGITWPLGARDVHLGIPEQDNEAPALPPEDVRKLIRGVKDTPGMPRALVCLATIYGLRSDEIARVLAKGCDGKYLEVQTAKLGKKRRHVIPLVLAPALTFPPYRVATRTLHDYFDKLMRTYAREPLPKEGWHSCRRACVTGLYEAGVLEAVITKWFGWSSRVIAMKYFRPEAHETDIAVYSKHPFLHAWVIE